MLPPVEVPERPGSRWLAAGNASVPSPPVGEIDGRLNLASAWEAIADEVGDSTAVSVAGRHYSWTDFDDRAARLAGTMLEHGLGPDSKVALYLYNGNEYPEAQYAAFKVRGIPANVNYRYTGDELAYILENSDAEAIFFDHTLADRLEAVRDRCPMLRLAVQVGGGEVPDWALGYEEAVSADPMPRIDRSGSDLWFLYTGGTTGMPKAVMWDHTNLFGSMEATFRPFRLPVPSTPAEAAATARSVADAGKEIRQLCAAPLMHGTSGIPGLATLSHGGMLSTLSSRAFDADELWRIVELDRITMVTMVGDAFGRPMLESLDRASAEGRMPDLSSLRLLLSSGVMFSAATKEAMLDHHGCTIVDSLGSSEGTGMASQVMSRRRRDTATARFRLGEHTRVLTDEGIDVQPGSGERGQIALGWPLPLGYFKDPAKTEEAFPMVAGRRWSIPGDWATVEADGTVTLLGRGSACINTGGEKVFPEEVEEALKELDAVVDCNVVGLDDDRWGQAVTAVVELTAPGAADADELRAGVRERLAGYKVPKRVVLVDRVERSPNGKTDYRWAKSVAEAAVND
ncbi:MAG TPA: acyl-CoA synthetase [Acidimicrobiaceae bacterium]|nr:acyl-CoA synthetase [Acidimicrobiaceae bacterium]